MKKVIYEYFDSLEQFKDGINSRGLNDMFMVASDKYFLQSQIETEVKTENCGTRSYAEADKLMTDGYIDPLEKIKAGVRKLEAVQTAPRKRSFTNVVGFAPHVPNAIAGIPQSMIDIKTTPEPTKIITLVYYASFSVGIEPEQIIKAGINMLGMVQQLERNGYRVALDILQASQKTKQIAALRINLKTHRQQIDYLKLTYPMVHPSMLRRHTLRWMETVPNLTDIDFIKTYGTPLYYDYSTAAELTDYLRSFKVINEREYVVPGFLAISNEPDKLIELCGIK
jgi:hypothetical protein